MIPVVGACIRKGDTILLAKRGAGALAGFYEFPGGKIEKGESAQEALVREIREELDVSVKPREKIGVFSNVSNGKTYVITVYEAELLDQPENIKPLEHDDVRWTTKEEAQQLTISDAERAVVELAFKKGFRSISAKNKKSL